MQSRAWQKNFFETIADLDGKIIPEGFLKNNETSKKTLQKHLLEQDVAHKHAKLSACVNITLFLAFDTA